VDDTYELFLDLDADAEQIDFPIVYACARDGIASLTEPKDARSGGQRQPRTAVQDDPLDLPAPTFTEGAPLQAHVVNLDASPFLGRLALCRVREGTIRKGQTVAWCRTDGTIDKVRISELLMTEGPRTQARREGRARRHHGRGRIPRS